MEQSLPLLSQTAEDDTQYLDIELEKASQRQESTSSKVIRYLLFAVSLLHSALPRFLQIGGLNPRKDRQHSTAWLDALRGYAACVVVKFHVHEGFSHREFFHFPIIHAFEAGRGSVVIFFVISGYVLSVRMLKMIRARNSAQLLGSLASATFRRWLRLYAPTAFATLLLALAMQMGWSSHEELRQPTLYQQLSHWVMDTIYASDPFHNIMGWWVDPVYRTEYLFQMWTIPIEFRGSMALFLFVLACCKLSTRGRMIACWMLIIACYRWQVVYVACFLAGLFIADISLSYPPDQLQKLLQLPQNQLDADVTPPGRRWQWRTIAHQSGFILMFIMGLFLLSIPEDTGINGPFPFQYISRLTPSYYVKLADEYFWLSIGAILLVLALEYSPILQAPLKWSFSLYLGEISFGIYATHVLMKYTIYENWLRPWQQNHLGDSIWADCLVGTIIFLFIFASGDYFTRVDTRIVAFGRWLQSKTFEEWE
ncbi:hypothetical protein LTR84_004429 [Exophiala bonariae]|uniref:Acyltransferase 3 domain-containing protein n=1 Tax=Exophiala bonariae TaxID=1690606 RepID=A0AAV9N4K5_9EURO|nr:hypothetical protein LTR84_004429 [Exophiala bonariae]